MTVISRQTTGRHLALAQAGILILALIVTPGYWVPAQGMAAGILGSGREHLAAAVSPNPAAPVPPEPLQPESIEDPIPRTGDQKLLVVLVDFSDKAGSITGQAWQQFFWGVGGFSDYFKENSYNQLRYTGDIVGMSGGAVVVNGSGVAYVRLPYPISYYAAGAYGFNVTPGQFPQNNGGVVLHALHALNRAGFNFAPYADSQTGRVENLLVVFAGSNYGYTFPPDPINSLEATAYSLTSAGGSAYTSSGGQVFNNYTFCPEKTVLDSNIARMGICVHEHGHALGLVDLYDLSVRTSGAGFFDLMAYGTYGEGYGARPFHMGAFSKEFADWVTPTVHYSGTLTVTLGPAESEPDFLKLYPGGRPYGTEYFLLENRQPVGFDQDWEVRDLCPGLVIWHVDRQIIEDYPYSANSTLGSPPGYPPPPHQGAIVVEADGLYEMIIPGGPLNYGECEDTWQPGQTWTAPASNLWGGTLSLLSVTVASASAGSVTLEVNAAVPEYSFWVDLPLVME